MRKLATIRKIDAINPIPNADAIEVATVGGWNVVVKKNQFKVDEYALYLEIDSWVPTELAPFLSKDRKEPREYMGVKGERLKTVRLRGQISQGLLLPINDISKEITIDDYKYSFCNVMWEDGEDVTDYLGILKWEPQIPAQLAGIMKGNFPSFIQKTDQERIQNIKQEFEDALNTDEVFELTEKLHGSSMTVYWEDREMGVCSRNIDLKESDDNAFWKIAKSLNLKEKFEKFAGDRNIALQGELIGNGLNGNQYGLSGHAFKIFDVYDIDAGCKMLPKERYAMLAQLEFVANDHVPIIGTCTLLSFGNSIKKFLEHAEGLSELNGSEREGIVFKSVERQFSFKVISNKWLLSNE